MDFVDFVDLVDFVAVIYDDITPEIFWGGFGQVSAMGIAARIADMFGVRAWPYPTVHRPKVHKGEALTPGFVEELSQGHVN